MRILSPLKKIHLDKLDVVHHILADCEKEIDKLKMGLEVHGMEPEWEWTTLVKRKQGKGKQKQKQRGRARTDDGEGEDGDGGPQDDAEEAHDELADGEGGESSARGAARRHIRTYVGDDSEGARPSTRVFMKEWKDHMQRMVTAKLEAHKAEKLRSRDERNTAGPREREDNEAGGPRRRGTLKKKRKAPTAAKVGGSRVGRLFGGLRGGRTKTSTAPRGRREDNDSPGSSVWTGADHRAHGGRGESRSPSPEPGER